MDAINLLKIDNLNIGRKLTLGFGLLIILAITSGVMLFVIASLVEGMFVEVRAADEVATLANQINVELLDMRRDEKNFLLRYSSQSFEGAYGNYALSNRRHSQKLLDLVSDIEQRVPQETERQQRYASFLSKIKVAILDYQIIFDALIENIRLRGGQKRGLMNDVLVLLDGLDAEIDATNKLELKVAVSNLQQAFLSYLRFGLKSTGYNYQELPIQEHIDQFQDEAKRLHTLIKQNDDLANQAELLAQNEEAQKLFETLLALDNEIVEQETILSVDARSITTLAKRIIANEKEIQTETFARFITLQGQAIILAVLFFVTTMLASIFLAIIFTRSIATPITNLTDIAHRIAQAPTLRDWEETIQVDRQDELGMLTNSFGQMVIALKQAETEKVQLAAIEKELNLARTIQQNLLPPPVPNWSNIDLVCYTNSAREVGGDLYVYHAFGHPRSSRSSHSSHQNRSSQNSSTPRYGVALGDVSGKGTPAALLMAVSVSTFHATIWQSLTPPALLARMDKILMAYTQKGKQNCAFVYVEIERHKVTNPVAHNPATYALKAVNAGCIPPYIKRADGSVEFEELGGFALGQGLGNEMGYEQQTIDLQSGDMFVLTSDGVVEANNHVGEMLGFERLEAIMQAGPTDSAQAMLDYLKTALFAFTGDAEQHDDMTIVVTRV